MNRLEGKVAVVTGASKGIGAEIAFALATHGVSVVVNYASDAAGAEAVRSRIEKQGGRAVVCGADVTKPAERARLFDVAIDRFGRLDILVNNAGVFRFFPLAEVDDDNLAWMFQTNVFGLLLATRDAVQRMPSEGGCVINISSLASTSCRENTSVYRATKAAVDAITLSLAKELGPRNIRVNAIRPGAIETEGTISGDLISGERLKMFVETTPLRRIGYPADIAPAAVFLASDDAQFLTGETLLIAGGR